MRLFLLTTFMVTAGTVQKAAASYGLFDRENDRVPGSYRSRPQQVVLPTFARQQQRQQQQQQLQLRKSVNNLYNRNAIWGSSYEDTTVAADGGSSLELLGALPDAVQDEVEVLENRDCCPSVTELIHPLAGVSRSGLILEIYRGENKTQKFYQTSCRRDVKNRPCRFVRSKYELSSRCTQEYSYTYAIVRNLNSNGQWRMDHIRVRSGCACKVIKVTRQRSQEVRRRRK